MILQTGAEVGPYTVVGPARRQSRHARRDTSVHPRAWRAMPFTGGDPVALITAAHPDGPDATGPADPGAALRREWALAGSLRHPHLVTAHELIDTADGPVLVTAWADGGSVTDLLRGPGRLSAGQTVTLLAATARALAACHERGLVHGDVSPDTVMVAADGRPLLARVGRATAAADTGASPTAEPRCASPDVARGRAATAVDDVFAMGATAMQCLLGRPAWPAQDLRDVVIQSEFGQWPTVPPAEGGGPELAALVDAMLDADPARRPSVREVLDRLADCPTPEALIPTVGGPAPETVSESPDPGRAETAGRGRHRDEDDTPPDVPDRRHRAVVPHAPRGTARWPRVAAAVVAATAVAALAVAGGVWWAGSDRPATAALAAVAGTTPTSAAGAGTTTAGPMTAGDWAAVVLTLDRQRAAAFAEADASLLTRVYAADAPALAEDRARVEQLASAGRHVPGLAHEITAVEVVSATADGTTVAVTDALPAAPILDADGTPVGSTEPTTATRRLLTLTPVADGYRIAALAAA